MAILKCKICGGDIELNNDKDIGTCLYCGSTTTFPKVSDEQKVGMFNRGNHFRLAGEFDEALVIYEQIIQEDDKDAEAHWCAALSRFGIEYVEDPATMEYLPTCHRASFDSFLDDIDVKSAIDNSDGITKRQYQKDALKIEEVRQGILATSSKEDPFDVFICYKETDKNGGRTQDSVLAQDIYDRLTEKGYKVFFSRITLEDRVGTEYEPYIFASLNSAKAMIVVGTSKENLDSVWVKNEWSRFLAMMKKDRSKVILPCYKNMDPYDMPEALSALQSYNMAAMGFHQDLLRGISKILGANTARSTDGVKSVDEEIKPLLERVFLFLEDGKYKEADEYAEKVLDKDPKNTEAYIGKLMSLLRINHRNDLGHYVGDLESFDSYNKAIKFASDTVRKELMQYNENSKQEKAKKKEQDRKRTIKGIVIVSIIAGIAALILLGLRIYKVKVLIPKEKYEHAVNLIADQKYTEAIELFQELGDYNDCGMKIAECKELIIAEEKERVLREQENKIQQIVNAEVGASVYLGSYEIDEENKSPIEWIVIAKVDSKVLLLSKYGIIKMPFENRNDNNVEWRSSLIREWLNDQFYDKAFEEYEKKSILLNRISAYETISEPTDGDSEDKVFLLSGVEVEGYMNGVESIRIRRCIPLERVLKGQTEDRENTCRWWVRSLGTSTGFVKVVSEAGDVYNFGYRPDREDIYVRPAIWVSQGE